MVTEHKERISIDFRQAEKMRSYAHEHIGKALLEPLSGNQKVDELDRKAYFDIFSRYVRTRLMSAQTDITLDTLKEIFPEDPKLITQDFGRFIEQKQKALANIVSIYGSNNERGLDAKIKLEKFVTVQGVFEKYVSMDLSTQ